jgi:hypothetical protein
VTTLAAAATGHHASGLLVILALAVVTVGYVVACAVWPFRACRHCGGAGKSRSPTGRAFHHCRHCNGSGAQLRTGRRLFTLLSHRRDRANRDRPRSTPWRNP